MSKMDNQQDSLMQEYGIEPYTLITDILKNIIYIIIGGIAVALLWTVISSFRYVPQYTTKTTFVVSGKETNSVYGNLSSTNKMALTMEKILASTVMEKKICEELGIEREAFDATIGTSVIEGTNLLELSVTANNPKEAIDIIRIIMDNYSAVSLFTISNAALDVLQQPVIPYTPDNPLNVRDLMKKAFAVGALFWMLAFGICSNMANTIKQEDEIERKLDTRNYGIIPYERKNKTIISFLGKKNKNAILVDNPLSGFCFVENFKKLASKLEYNMTREGHQVVVVTSVSENEGKSTVTANLAISLAGHGHKVAIVDGDIRRPSQFLVLGVKPEEDQEIGEYLLGNTSYEKIQMETTRQNLAFIGGKGCYSTSTEMLHCERLAELIRRLKRNYDFVIIDTPPAGLIGDSQVFAHHADGVLLVVKQNMVLAEDINDVIDDFRDNHSKVYGVILNCVRATRLTNVGKYGAYGNYGKYYHNYSKKGK